VIEYDKTNLTIIDNLLPNCQFDNLINNILSDNFSWNLNRIDAPKFDTNYNAQFVHLFYLDKDVPNRYPGVASDKFSILFDILKIFRYT